MALLAPAEAEIILLQYMLGMKTDVTIGQALHLYSNDLSPVDTTSLTDFTEVTTTPYTPIALITGALGVGGWTIDPASGNTTAEYSEVTFSFDTDAVAYGYYVTDADTGGINLLWAERFSGAPFQIPDGGGTIAISSKLTLE